MLRFSPTPDPKGIITLKQITWHEGTRGTDEATDMAFNGSGWECYMCHRAFTTRHPLDQHLNSPAHRQEACRCPNGQKCGKEFVALAALFNHQESESCAFMRFEKVQTQGGQILSSNRMITFG